MKRRSKFISLIIVLSLIFTLTACSGATKSQTSNGTKELKFPEKPIELIVPYAAGGGTHLAAELLSPEAQEYLGQPLNIVCKPGAGGAVGASYVAQSKADGYTLLYATVALPTSLYMSDVEYEQDDFVGVAMASDIPQVLAVRADAPYNTAEELVEWAKANPGKFTWGFPGVGSSLHLTGANALNAMGITDLTKEVPFDGTAEGVAAVLGGHISAVSCFTTSLSEQIKAGQVKIIGIQAKERMKEYPDIPTFLEQGYDATLTSWRGVFAPKDTPKEVLDYLDKAIGEIIATDSYLKRAVDLGEGRVYQNSADFTKTYNDQCVLIEQVVEELGLTKQ